MTSWERGVLDAWRAGQRLSAVGPGPVEAHLEHARALSALIPADAAIGVDLGCGAGVPGLALVGLRPDVHWWLLDASQRRIRLVRDALASLGWQERATAVHGRAEDVASVGLPAADVIVARLFGPPAVTAECAAPLLAPHGSVLVTEPVDSTSADRWSTAGLAMLGLALGPRSIDPAIQVLHRVGAPEDRFPRKPGVARKRPLW